MNVRIADRVRIAVTIVATLIMMYALFVSRDHITHVAHLIGLDGYQAATLFVLIDLPALVGKAMMLPYFARSTRNTGRVLMMLSGSLSVVCNVTSGWFGGGVGPAAYGAFVVGMFLILEWAVVRIKPAASVTRARNADVAKTQPPALTNSRQQHGRKCAPGCACGKHRAAAPVSPGRPPVDAPTAAAIDAIVG